MHGQSTIKIYRWRNLLLGVRWLSSGNHLLAPPRQSVCQSVSVSVCPDVRTCQRGRHWTEFYKIYNRENWRRYVEKIQMWLKSDKISGILHQDLRTFLSFSKGRGIKHKLWSGFLSTFRLSRDRRLLTSPWLSVRLPVDEFSWNLVLGTLRNSDKKLQICWKLKEKADHFTWE